MRSMIEARSCFAGAKRTVAFSLARLTLASTPSSRLRFFSMRAAQAAQVMPSMSSSTSSMPLLHEQQRQRRDLQHLGRGRAEDRLADGAQAAAADADEVAAALHRVLDDGLGDLADQRMGAERDPGGVQLLLR